MKGKGIILDLRCLVLDMVLCALEKNGGVWVLSHRLMLPTCGRLVIFGLSLIVGPRYKVPNSSLVVLSQLHSIFLIDFLVKVIMVSMRNGGRNVLEMVISSTLNARALLKNLLGPIGPLFILHLFPTKGYYSNIILGNFWIFEWA